MQSTTCKLPATLLLILLSFGLCSQQSVAAQTKPPKYKAVLVEFSIPPFGETTPLEVPLNNYSGPGAGIGGGGAGSFCGMSAEDLKKSTEITNYSYSMSARNFRKSQIVMVNLTLTLRQGNGTEIPLKETLYVSYDEVREVSLPHNVKVKLYLKPPTPPEKKPASEVAKPVSEPLEPQIEEDDFIEDSQTLNLNCRP